MASRRKLPLVLFLITLVLLAGAVVLLLRGRPVTLEQNDRPGQKDEGDQKKYKGKFSA